MKNSLNLKSLLPWVKKGRQEVIRHAVFLAIFSVLLIYVLLVWKINSLANAEPTASAVTAEQAKTTVPKIDKNAIKQIQNLEQTNTQVKSLFDEARNNPFQE